MSQSPNRFAIDKTLAVEGDIRLHYRDWGGEGWPLLLLHGLSSTAHIWDLVAPLLVDEAHVIALDLRGHGLSDKPDSDYTYETIGPDIFNVIASLEIDRPVLIGHSFGANIGLWVAAQDAELLSGLIMIDGGVMDLSDMSWQQTLERLTPPRISGTPLADFRAMLHERAPQGLISPAVEAAILANFEVDEDNLIHRRLPREYHLRILRSMWETHLEPLYADVACPVLLLPCRRLDSDAGEMLKRKQEGVLRAEAKIDDVETVWLENTVHDAPLQRPHKLAEEIVRFLRERI